MASITATPHEQQPAGNGADPFPLRLNVLYEDDVMLAVDKPAGLLVHGDGTGAPTLTESVRTYLEASRQAQAAREVQAVQRLDVDTTGVVVFSKAKRVQAQLDADMAQHGCVRKCYLALCRGAFPWEHQIITLALGRDRHNARLMRLSTTGKPARTQVHRLCVTGARQTQVSLLLVELETGRKHQIRTHLAAEGFPLLGDKLYGVPADRHTDIPLMLHAYEERLPHPISHETLVIRAPIPERIQVRVPNAVELVASALDTL